MAAAWRDLIGADAAVIDETITHSRTIARHLMAETPGRYRYVQGGLGRGLGVALGAKLVPCCCRPASGTACSAR